MMTRLAECTRNAKLRSEHFTQISPLKLTDIAKRYFRQRANADCDS